MKWKTILLFLIALALIVGSFVVPPILLQRSISRSTEKSYLTDSATPSLKPSENLVEKLACLNDPETEFVALSMAEDIGRLSTTLYEEVNKLSASGAIPRAVFQEMHDSLGAEFSEDIWVERYCVIQPTKHLMFEVYVISPRDNNGQIIFDLSSEKILGIAYNLFNNDLLAVEMDEAQAIRELQGWADYLDLTPGRISRTNLSINEITGSGEALDPVILKEIILTDKAGNSVSFCQTFSNRETTTGYYTWESTH